MSSAHEAESPPSPHERIAGLYESNAAAWDRQRGRDLFEKPWLDRFASRLPPGATILDLGCGMGEPIARYLIEQGFEVTGLDSSSSLIAMARKRFPEQEWIVGDMRGLDLGRRFAGLIVWHSSFHLTREDQRGLFPRFAAHLDPGGILMFTSGDRDGVRIGEWQSQPLYHASLDSDGYRGLLEENGFTILAHQARDPECGDATLWIARLGGEQALAEGRTPSGSTSRSS